MRTVRTAAALGLLSALVALGALPAAAAESLPPAPTPEQAASSPQTLDTLSRFFARDGALARTAAAPRVDGASVPVRVLSPDFVAGKPGAPVARVEFRASRAVASDGQKASLWTVKQPGGWQVVNIATGDDEIRYAEMGRGGLVFREPQIDAWYVQKGAKVLPLDEDAVRAVGRDGTSLAAYRSRVAHAYGDKLPGSAYARKGAAGGYDVKASGSGAASASASASASAESGAGGGTVAAGAGLGVLLLAGALRRRRTART
ncbi:hypothetical protein ACFU8I_34480 [Streptomyces sp. NPDC057540]|uniref:hypothetical protein n=1 Tax=Streptomyces sp. NPDC057540 TaxID=3346160 RepID=UPI0036BBC2D1